MIKRYEMRKGDDFHCHLRRDDILRSVITHTVSQFRRVVVMPNTNPPILNGLDAVFYYEEVFFASLDRHFVNDNFQPLMTIQITDYTTPVIIEEVKNTGVVVAAKIYPLGVTTNSYNGVTDFQKLYPVFEVMQERGILLLIHGESPDFKVFCLDKERVFLDTLVKISCDFPSLKIVLEHITTKDAVETVLSLPYNVAATITIHHLFLTLDDIIGDSLKTHNFCKPIAKRPEDREALRQAAISGNSKFFYGGDSAPHLKDKKECAYGCAGIFNAPVALPLLVQIFEEYNALDKLENFTSVFGANFYGLPLNNERIKLIRKKWIVPNEYEGIVPFMAGETLLWRVDRTIHT